MEAIAARAGVGKATIYRRWKNKEALFAEAVESIALVPEVPDTGTVRGDLDAASSAAIGRLAPEAFRVVPRLMAEAAGDPELRADVVVELVTEMLIGPLVTRALVSGGDPTTLAGLPMRVYDTLAAGIAAGRRVG